MKIHETDRIIMAKHEILPLKEFQEQKENDKPNGLWYAVGEEWINWVKSEMPEWEGKFLYKLELNFDKILHLKNAQDIDTFSKKFSITPEYFKSIDPGGMGYNFYDVDWIRVSKEYSGIEISPYQYEQRFETRWYYGWDVASGCVWKKDAILDIKILKE